MGTLKGFSNPPAMVRRRRSRRAPHATKTAPSLASMWGCSPPCQCPARTQGSPGRRGRVLSSPSCASAGRADPSFGRDIPPCGVAADDHHPLTQRNQTGDCVLRGGRLSHAAFAINCNLSHGVLPMQASCQRAGAQAGERKCAEPRHLPCWLARDAGTPSSAEAAFP